MDNIYYSRKTELPTTRTDQIPGLVRPKSAEKNYDRFLTGLKFVHQKDKYCQQTDDYCGFTFLYSNFFSVKKPNISIVKFGND